MRDDGRGEAARYEDALRIIGRHLDSVPSYHASVVEVPTGFTVRWRPARHKTENKLRIFAWEKLDDLDIFNSASRNVRRREQPHRGIWNELPTGHEDFFRAFGHGLDAAAASALTIDEVPGGLAVSWVQPAGESGRLEKLHRVYKRAEIEQLINDAQGRRRTRIFASA